MRLSFVQLAGWILVGVLWLLAAPGSGFAAVVIPKDSGEPVFGYLLKNEPNRVVLRETLSDGGTRDREFARTEIDELIVTVDPARLQELRPDDPRGYLEYAEDLAEKRRDPEARDTALRLYVIAAWLAPEQHGRGALLGMTALARSPEERRAFRALAFTLDGYRDPALLREESVVGTRARPTAKDTPASDGLLECVRQLRRGNRTQAKRQAERKEIKAEFARLQGLVSYDDFLAACLDPAPPESLLRALVQAELALMPAASATDVDRVERAKVAAWLPVVVASAPRLPALSLERVTEFDPRQCRFQAGKWGEAGDGHGPSAKAPGRPEDHGVFPAIRPH